MKVRTTSVEDYPELTEWWKWFRFPAPSIAMLPNNMDDGIMVSKDGINICAGFIYSTPSVIYWCEYIVSNPNVRDNTTRKEAIELLINTISQVATDMGAKAIFTSVKNENLLNRYLSCGYIRSSNTTELIKLI